MNSNAPTPGSSDIPPAGGSLRERSVRGGAVTLASQAVSYSIQVVSVVLLARLLTPEDYGLIAMVSAVTGFAALFKDLGLSTATIQKGDVTSDQISTLFWINLVLGGLLTLAVAIAAPVVAWFFGRPELGWVTVALSLSFLVQSFGAQSSALLNRQMRFRALAVVNVLGQLLGLVASLLAAWQGARHWALVLGTLTASLGSALGVFLAAGWRPAGAKKGCGLRQFVRFGANVTGFNFVNYFHRQLDNILIGRVWGPDQLGLYNRAYSLLMLPITNLREPLLRVAFPALSRLQHEPARFRSYFIKYCSTLAFLSMPLVAFLFVCSENLIRLLLGSRWLGASSLFAILALASFIQPVASLRGLVLLAVGESGRYFRWGAWNAALCSLAFFAGLSWGAQGVALAYTLATYCILPPSLLYVFRGTPVRPSDFYLAILRPATASIVTAVALLGVRSFLIHLPDFWLLAICFLAAALFYLGLLCLLPGGRRDLAEYLSYLQLVMPRARMSSVGKPANGVTG